jgi:hypothetical protein
MSRKTTKEQVMNSDAFKRLTHEFGSMTEQEAEAYIDGLRTDRPMVEMITNVAETIDGIGGMSGRQAVNTLMSGLAQITVGMATDDLEAAFMQGFLEMQGTLFYMIHSVGGTKAIVQMLEVMQERGAILKDELATNDSDDDSPDDGDDIFTKLHKERQTSTGSHPA